MSHFQAARHAGCYSGRTPHEMTTAGEKFQRLVEIMARLRGPNGCPWDRDQTFDTIKPYTLEETYEVLDAVDRRAWPELAEELGDFVLQAVFYAQMASEQSLFSIDDALDAINPDTHPGLDGQPWRRIIAARHAVTGATFDEAARAAERAQ